MNKKSDKTKSLLICLILTLATFAVYFQVHSFAFVTFDDPGYVYNNPNIQAGVTINSIKWALTTGDAANWHPLTWLSHILDWQLYGSNAGGHHLTSLFFHIANVLLLFLVLKQMTNAIWQSAFVAALFALHPLHVESVAWVSERKDVLSTFFWLLTMAAYLRYVKQPTAGRYIVALLLFALGLMAKPMLVTLPFVLLLLDYWPLERKISWRLLVEKIPFLSLAAGSSVITFFVQRSSEAVVTITTFPLEYRFYNAAISYAEYIEKMFWPVKMAFFYPNPGQSVSIPYAVMSAIFLTAVSIIVLLFSKNHRYLFTGWFWYIGTLVPVIGFVQVGSQAMADRYSYITLTGLFIIIAWGLPELLAKWTSASSVGARRRKIALQTAGYTVLCVLASITYIQTGYWKNTLTLSGHAVEVTEDNFLGNVGVAQELFKQHQIEQVIGYFSEAIRIKSDYAAAFNGLGVALCYAGRIDEAIVNFNKALALEPENASAHNNLGIAIGSQGKYDEAIVHFKKALQIDPQFIDAKNNLNLALTKINQKK
jgi:tetratricopeptide (TPR) repeat protein